MQRHRVDVAVAGLRGEAGRCERVRGGRHHAAVRRDRDEVQPCPDRDEPDPRDPSVEVEEGDRHEVRRDVDGLSKGRSGTARQDQRELHPEREEQEPALVELELGEVQQAATKQRHGRRSHSHEDDKDHVPS